MSAQSEQDFHDFKSAQESRFNFEWTWQRVSDYVIPRRADFTVQRSPGTRRDYAIYDSTAPWALDQLAAALQTLLTSQSLPWFYLSVRDQALMDRPDVQAWVEDSRQRINAVINDPNTRFQSQIHELYLDLAAFGTGVMFVDYDQGSIHFSTRFLGECFIRQTHYGVVDTCFRLFPLSRSRIIEKFGAATPADIVKEKDNYKEFAILHACVPDDTGWGSRYYYYDKQELIEEGRYNEFPYLIPRWAKSAFEDYGRSPAINCLADILMVNDISKTMLKAAHRAVSPPLLVPDNGYVQAINLNPDKINYYDVSSAGEIKYLESKGQLNVGQVELKARQEAIVRAFYVDMLQLPGGLMPGATNQNTYMSATEATMRRENQMRVMGPVVSRLSDELLNPLITRIFSILKSQRSLPPAPMAMRGKGIDIIYQSPLAIAQRGAEVDSFIKALQALNPLAQIDPSIYRRINGDATLDFIFESYHTPKKLLYTEQQMAQMDAKAQAQQDATVQANQSLSNERANLMHSQAVSKIIGSVTA